MNKNCVVKTLVAVLSPDKGRVYDPCCGSGGMFVQSERFVEAHGGERDAISIYGTVRKSQAGVKSMASDRKFKHV